MKIPKPELILWGSHPSHCDGAWLKLTDKTSFAECERWRKDGWDVRVLARGDHPDGQISKTA